MKDPTMVGRRARRPVSPGPYLGARGEFDFVRRIRERAGAGDRDIVKGIGDDCAVLRQHYGRDTVITADLLVEDIDFQLEYTPPRLLGHKALAISISDIASMGASPRWAMISLGAPTGVWGSGFLDEFYEGFFQLSSRFGVTLIGGDVSRTPDAVVIDSIVLGETLKGGAIPRSGARPGDYIFVTGALGGSAGGLRLLRGGQRRPERGARSRRARDIEHLLLRHLSPQPRLAWGELLGRQRIASAMIDISDGLSSDLSNICNESGTGAVVEEARIPIDASLQAAVPDYAGRLALALNGGEDFELLFAVRPRNLKKVPRLLEGVAASLIGRMTSEPGKITLVSNNGHVKLIQPAGFAHFS